MCGAHVTGTVADERVVVWEDRQRAERERINPKQRGTPSGATGNETADTLRYMRRG